MSTNMIYENYKKFGYEQIERETKIKRLLAESDRSRSQQVYSQTFMNQLVNLPIITVPIGLPMYRLQNGRTLSLQDEYLATHPELESDFFYRDLNSPEAQEIQHSLLLELIRKKETLDYFKNPKNVQQEPIICTNTGFVVNGNRRLSCWRYLFYSETGQNTYKHFEYIRIAILPECEERAIEELEVELQIVPDIRADYSWHAEAQLMKKRQVQKGESLQQIATFFKVNTDKEVEEKIQMLDYAEEYLKRNGLERQWSKVSDDDFAFQAIIRNRKNILNPLEKALFDSLAFAYLTVSKNDEIKGRLYGKIPEIRKYLPEIILGLSVELPLDTDTTTAEEDDSSLLMGYGTPSEKDTSVAQITKAISEPINQKQAVEITESIIEDQKSLDKETKTSNFIIEQVRRANTCLQNVVVADLSRTDFVTNGLEQQLSAISKNIDILRGWLTQRANNN